MWLLSFNLIAKVGFFHGGTRLLGVRNSSRLAEELRGVGAGRVEWVVLACSPTQGVAWLEAALLAGLLRPGARVLLPCLGLPPPALSRYLHLGAEISVMQPAGWNGVAGPDYHTALLLDCLGLLERALLTARLAGWSPRPARLHCDHAPYWTDGARLVEGMRVAQFLGRTGRVAVSGAVRANLSLALHTVRAGQLEQEGVWCSATGYLAGQGAGGAEGRSGTPGPAPPPQRVVTVLSDPYTMLKPDTAAAGRQGNDRYEGFAVDLITEIARIVGFNFSLSVVSGYGSRRQDGSWTGMVGEILEDRADMAVADIRQLSCIQHSSSFSCIYIEIRNFGHRFICYLRTYHVFQFLVTRYHRPDNEPLYIK